MHWNSLVSCALGFTITRRASNEGVRALIQRLRPVKFEGDLIRLGGDNDGGYLIPDDLEGLDFCFSPGVSDNSSFEEYCANQGMEVFLADASVDGPAASHPKFNFEKKFLGAVSKGNFMTLDKWFNDKAGLFKGDGILQMDIEGFEYEVLLGLSEEVLKRFRIVVLEIHNVHLLWSEPLFALYGAALEKLLETHACVHAHGNNCHPVVTRAGIDLPMTMELTFLSRDRVVLKEFVSKLPHPLDQPNLAHKSEINLGEAWCSSSR